MQESLGRSYYMFHWLIQWIDWLISIVVVRRVDVSKRKKNKRKEIDKSKEFDEQPDVCEFEQNQNDSKEEQRCSKSSSLLEEEVECLLKSNHKVNSNNKQQVSNRQESSI